MQYKYNDIISFKKPTIFKELFFFFNHINKDLIPKKFVNIL